MYASIDSKEEEGHRYAIRTFKISHLNVTIIHFAGLNSSFFQGDIVLTADLIKLLNDTSNSRRRRAIKKDLKARWKNAVVPFVYDKRLSKFNDIILFLKQSHFIGVIAWNLPLKIYISKQTLPPFHG